VINKFKNLPEEAVADISDGSIIGVGGFSYAGSPLTLVKALAVRKVKNLTIVGMTPTSYGALIESGSIRKLISPYPSWGLKARHLNPLEELWRRGDIEVEIIPMGTLAERLRAAGAGLGPFYCPVGIGTEMERGKEKRVFNNIEYLLEFPMPLDYAFVKGHKGDRFGNVCCRLTTKNYNPVMAMAAKITIVEVDEIVEPGGIDPEATHIPGIFVNRVVLTQEKPKVEWWLKQVVKTKGRRVDEGAD